MTETARIERPAYRTRVGSARPSHLMYTSGVGALVDLPNLSVIVRGLDDWDYRNVVMPALSEPRLLEAVHAQLGRQVAELRAAPWLQHHDHDGPDGQWAHVGVPVAVFPQWLRCTACNTLAPVSLRNLWRFENANPYRPDEARFVHATCQRGTSRRRPAAVAARYVLACRDGHLDDFPYREFVHSGPPCEPGALLIMIDNASNAGPNVQIRCLSCETSRNMMAATGKNAETSLPRCRGRHPHLQRFDPTPCDEPVKMLTIGASNQWFPAALSSLAIPAVGASAIASEVERLWPEIGDVETVRELGFVARGSLPVRRLVERFGEEAVVQAIAQHRMALAGGERTQNTDLKHVEWEVLTATTPPPPSEDYAVHRTGPPTGLTGLLADVVQVERLRAVRAFIGFTRIDPPDLAEQDTGRRAPIDRAGRPTWVPAAEVRGEGIFLRLREDVVAAWQERVADTAEMRAHRAAYRRFRENRNSGRNPTFDPDAGWPGTRYYALHTLSHLAIREIAMECGYSAASLVERLYPGTEDDPAAGILIYTAAPDSEGTLGGLVSLGEPAHLDRLLHSAMRRAQRCSSDPLCAEQLPAGNDDFLHGAACHVCLFVSETTCERGNRFLDRRLIVDLGAPNLVLTPELS